MCPKCLTDFKCMYSWISVNWHLHNWRGATLFSIPFIKQYLYWPKLLQEIVFLCPLYLRWSTIQSLCAAITILRLVALSGFLTISSVSKLVHILSLVVPATVCLLILGTLGAIMIAQWAQRSKSQYENAYWKVLTPELLELGAIFFNRWSIRVSRL